MIRERARAKINLTLRVLGRRSDGYHEIDSLISFAEDAFDIVSLDLEKPVSLTISGPFAGAIVGKNIVETALECLAGTAPDLRLGAIHIKKNLPVAAGIGGGSANAAALLRAVSIANPGLSKKVDWMAVASRLGADVPACLANTPCRATGLGEKLETLPPRSSLNAILVNAQENVRADKTSQIFRLLAAKPLGPCSMRLPAIVPANDHDLMVKLSNVGNDLESAASQAFPAVAAILRALRSIDGCRYAAMSGAGPTCFGLFDTADEAGAAKAATSLASNHPGWWIKTTKL